MCLVISGISFSLGCYGPYRNTPHDSTGEKPSFLLFGIDCRSPSEAAYLKPAAIYPVDIDDYREELQVSVTSARKLAATTIQRSKRLSTTNRPTVRNRHLKLDSGFWYISHKIILDLPINYHGGMGHTE